VWSAAEEEEEEEEKDVSYNGHTVAVDVCSVVQFLFDFGVFVSRSGGGGGGQSVSVVVVEARVWLAPMA
jgi:hypothetical protein